MERRKDKRETEETIKGQKDKKEIKSETFYLRQGDCLNN